MTIDASDACEAAIYQALVPAVSPVTVYQHVPEPIPSRMVVIGEISEEPLGTKGNDPDRRVTVQILTAVEGEERKPVRQIMAQVDGVLDGATLTYDGWRLAFTLAGSEAGLDAETGIYLGTSRFDVLALRDD